MIMKARQTRGKTRENSALLSENINGGNKRSTAESRFNGIERANHLQRFISASGINILRFEYLSPHVCPTLRVREPCLLRIGLISAITIGLQDRIIRRLLRRYYSKALKQQYKT